MSSFLRELQCGSAMNLIMEEAGDDGAASSGGDAGDTTATEGGGDEASTAGGEDTSSTDGGAQGDTDLDNEAGEGDQKTAQDETDDDASSSDFKIPDEHKDKSWAPKVKNEADLYKQLDNLTEMAGKKAAYPDADATPEQMDEYFKGLRPESAETYDFGEDHPNPEIAAQFGEMLFDANLAPHQAQKLIESYNAFEQRTLEEQTSAEGFDTVMKASFGDKYDADVQNVVKEMKQHLSADDQALIETIPNTYLGAIYRLTSNMQKAYGSQEGGDSVHSQKGGNVQGTDWKTEATGLRNEMHKLVEGPHTQAEKDTIQAKIDAIYQQNINNQKG